MIARGQGRIINVSSETGLRPYPHFSAYSVSKTALLRLSAHVAGEVKEHGISVFAIHPGGVRTSMTEFLFLSDLARKWFPEIYAFMAKGGGGTPQRAAELVLFLASGRADALSGCYVSVGDDVAEMVARADEIQRDELHTLRLRT